MILDPYRQLIDDYLAEDAYQATWIFDRLQKSGYQGSYKTVQQYVRSVKDRRGRLAYSRFETEPGLQAQVSIMAFSWLSVIILTPRPREATFRARKTSSPKASN